MRPETKKKQNRIHNFEKFAFVKKNTKSVRKNKIENRLEILNCLNKHSRTDFVGICFPQKNTPQKHQQNKKQALKWGKC